MRLVLRTLLFVAALTAATTVEAQMPVGIPNPPFGINETPGPSTYYVDNTNPNSTDTSNPNGTPTRPRRTVPTTLPAGAVVEVAGGPYTLGSIRWSSSGTGSSPVFVKGVNNPVFQNGDVVLSGSYFIIDGLVFDNAQLAPNGDHIVVRRSAVRNFNPGGNSAAIAPYGSYIVLYQNEINNNGDPSGTAEIDIHGIKPDTGTSYLWIIGNNVHHNGGDAVQIGNANSAEPWANHIYVGGNTLHEDRENGVDIKRSRDVIVSENTIYGYAPTSSSSGEATVTHNGAQRIWFINNVVRNSNTGIVCSGADAYYVVGNVIHDIVHAAGTTYSASSFYGTQAILTYGTSNAYFVGNTIWNVDSGISYPSTLYKAEFVNNVIGSLLQPSQHIGVENSSAASVSVFANNLISGAVRIRWGSSTATSSLSACSNCRTGDPRFVNAAAYDYRLTSGSPAIDAGMTDSVYATFVSLYGLSIARDPAGIPRPQNPIWDIGAYEFPGGPAPPTNLRIIR